MFNEGYKRSGGDQLIKESLCWEAIRLVCILTELPNCAPESAASLSLLIYAIALSKLEGPAAGLEVINKFEFQKSLEYYALLYAAKADMYSSLSDYSKAKTYYQQSFDLTESESDKWFIKSKIKDCDLHNINQN